jgi:hypothetical protein
MFHKLDIMGTMAVRMADTTLDQRRIMGSEMRRVSAVSGF